MAELVFACSTCSSADPVTGMKVRMSAGEAWWGSDPFVKRMPHLFTDSPPVVRGVRSGKAVEVKSVLPVVEQATAVPGVKRTVKRVTEK